jgi:hypothetical protein
MAQDGRLSRRMIGVLVARLPEAGLDRVKDPRRVRGRRWKLDVLLRLVVVALVAGCKSLMQAEALSNEMSVVLRQRLGIARRIADTTLRDVLCALDPEELRGPLHSLVRVAHRRKALEPDGLPFGVVALDGKSTALPSCDDHYAQRQSQGEGAHLIGVLRSVTCTLVSSRAKPCIDAISIPAATNEMGHFELALRRLVEAYSGIALFDLVSYDAGACSEHNGSVVRELGLHYLFGLKGTQPTLLNEAQRLLATLGPERATAATTDVLGNSRSVVRRLYLSEEMVGFGGWKHLRSVLRVESETFDRRQRVAHENRYYVASLQACRLSAPQWLLLVRRHWGVENNCHHSLDTAFEEDDRPWIESDPRGALVVALLRRLAYNLLTLFRSVTQRGDERRATPWLDLLRWFYNAIISATDDQLRELRPRPLARAP